LNVCNEAFKAWPPGEVERRRRPAIVDGGSDADAAGTATPEMTLLVMNAAAKSYVCDCSLFPLARAATAIQSSG
jgi:hypothetical protein